MCGIIGYIGTKDCVPVLIDGLKKLEYRGYDSAGIAVYNNGGIMVKREVGNLEALQASLAIDTPQGTWGLGHTRWATHGRPSRSNAHPHVGCNKDFAVVHNGIIENYQELKDELLEKGHRFSSETDSEVIAHLLESVYNGDLLAGVKEVVGRLQGSYALAIMSAHHPGELIAVRQNSPLILGLGQGENFLASDIPALLPFTRDVIIMEDGEIARLNGQKVEIYNGMSESSIQRPPKRVNWDVEMVEKGGFPHFMLKEIHEQPSILRRLFAGKLRETEVVLAGLDWSKEKLDNLTGIHIIACGTAYHSGLIGKRILEGMIKKPVEVDLASEFRYRDPLVGAKTLVIIVSQSGETADTLAALRHARGKGAPTLAIVNVQESSIAREADQVIYLQAGPEIAVASTKAYLAMLGAFYLLGCYCGGVLEVLPPKQCNGLINGLKEAPLLAETVLQEITDRVKEAAAYLADWDNAFFIGRGVDFGLALEGALKLKEISYIHAEAYAAGELKHGTLALITEGVPVVVFATQAALVEKTISNIQEIRSRGGYIIAVTREQLAEKITKESDFTITLPDTDDILMPLLAVYPLQLIAYYTACNRGCSIDQPRNLAKSVTVE